VLGLRDHGEAGGAGGADRENRDVVFLAKATGDFNDPLGAASCEIGEA
jgi:hypothetical protein